MGAQRGEGIHERGGALGSIPWPLQHRRLRALRQEIPEPHHPMGKKPARNPKRSNFEELPNAAAAWSPGRSLRWSTVRRKKPPTGMNPSSLATAHFCAAKC